MADKMAVMNGGFLQQYDSPANVFANPVNMFVASFVGSPAMSLIPLTAPVSIMVLMTMGELRDWQLALSLLIMLLSIALVVWGASRLFRRGILMYDQRLSLRQIASILRRG